MKRKVFDGEYISAEDGTESQLINITAMDVLAKVRRMKDGDSIVINAREEEVSL